MEQPVLRDRSPPPASRPAGKPVDAEGLVDCGVLEGVGPACVTDSETDCAAFPLGWSLIWSARIAGLNPLRLGWHDQAGEVKTGLCAVNGVQPKYR